MKNCQSFNQSFSHLDVGLSPQSNPTQAALNYRGHSVCQSFSSSFSVFMQKQSFVSSFNCLLLQTCSIKIFTGIISEGYICAVHGLIIPNLVLLQHLCVANSTLHRPHAGHGKQNHLITPEISLEQQAKVLFIKDKGGFQPLVGSSLSSLTPYNGINASNLLT